MYNFIILAAGNGTRMNSNIPKVLHKISDRTMLEISISLAKTFDDSNITVVISENINDNYKNAIPNNVNYVIQRQQLGTADAVKIGLKNINTENNKTIILYADNPLMQKKTIESMISALDAFNVVVLGFIMEEINKYGKIITKNHQTPQINQLTEILDIKESKEYKTEEQQPKLCNSGFLAFRTEDLIKNISKVDNNNQAKEYYLTQMIEILITQGKTAGCIVCENEEVYGVNTPEELKKAEEIIIQRKKDV